MDAAIRAAIVAFAREQSPKQALPSRQELTGYRANVRASAALMAQRGALTAAAGEASYAGNAKWSSKCA
jgi:hypothetical protein